MIPTDVSLGAVTATDFEELAALRIAAMRASLEQVGRFDPERARERLRKSFHPEHTQFILLDGQRIGFYTFRPADDGWHLDHFYIHPDWQSRGVGSVVMRRLLAQADDSRRAIHLGALRESASNRFYQRHGFTQTAEDEWDIYYVRTTPMECVAPRLLRHVAEGDLPVFFQHQQDSEAIRMAAFTAREPADRAAFAAHWERIFADPTIVVRTIVVGGNVAGHIMSYGEAGHPEVTCWLGREYWGRGHATSALAEFLTHENQIRPMYARAAKDNTASIRVLEKCGFVITGEDRGFAHGRGAEVEEWSFQLGEGTAAP